MLSKTKAKVTKEGISAICLHAFNLQVASFSELNDGFYNISYLVQLEDGREVVLKIAPPSDVEILTYEKDIMYAEVLFYKLTKEQTSVPVPEVFGEDFSLSIIPFSYYFMSKLEGKPLTHVKEVNSESRGRIYKQLAKILAEIHTIKGDDFGYISMKDKCVGKTYFDAFMVSVEELFKDGLKKTIDYPIELKVLEDLFNQCEPTFNEVSEPCMVHYDLWDGNIFVTEEDGLINIEGVIDFERGFYGDPAADLAQVIGYVDLDENSEFFIEYNKHTNEPITYNKSMKIRTYAYRLYLILIMHIECFYRDIDGSFNPQKEWVSKEIHQVYKNLKEAIEV